MISPSSMFISPTSSMYPSSILPFWQMAASKFSFMPVLFLTSAMAESRVGSETRICGYRDFGLVMLAPNRRRQGMSEQYLVIWHTVICCTKYLGRVCENYRQLSGLLRVYLSKLSEEEQIRTSELSRRSKFELSRMQDEMKTSYLERMLLSWQVGWLPIRTNGFVKVPSSFVRDSNDILDSVYCLASSFSMNFLKELIGFCVSSPQRSPPLSLRMLQMLGKMVKEQGMKLFMSSWDHMSILPNLTNPLQIEVIYYQN